MMKWLRKRIINWLFGVDYVWYKDLFKTYNEIYDSYSSIYNAYVDVSNKFISNLNETKEFYEKHVEMIEHCDNILNYTKKLEAKLKDNNIDFSDLHKEM